VSNDRGYRAIELGSIRGRRKGILLNFITFTEVLKDIHCSTQYVPGPTFPRLNLSEREASQSFPSSTEIKNCGATFQPHFRLYGVIFFALGIKERFFSDCHYRN
jgi:hypothetical protein